MILVGPFQLRIFCADNTLWCYKPRTLTANRGKYRGYQDTFLDYSSLSFLHAKFLWSLHPSNPSEQGPEQAVLFAPASSMETWRQQTHRGLFQPQLYRDSVKFFPDM